MTTREADPQHFIRRARQIKARLPILLSQWGLVPKFKRWRLAQDPENGMVVLFGVLDNKYIAGHTTTPFADYFDPRVLNDLARELQVEVVPSANDGLRYAFVLESGDPASSQQLPEHATTTEEGLPTPAPTEPIEPLPQRQRGTRRSQIGLIKMRSTPRQPHSYVLVDDVAIAHQRLTGISRSIHAHNTEVDSAGQAKFNQQMADLENTRRNLPD